MSAFFVLFFNAELLSMKLESRCEDQRSLQCIGIGTIKGDINNIFFC